LNTRRSQVGALYLHIRRIEQDRIGRPRSWLGRKMLLHRAAAFFAGLSLRRRRAYLEQYVRRLEREVWHHDVTALDDLAIGDPLFFAAEKAATLHRFDRHPREVTEGFLDVGESRVGGHPVAPRRIFFQRWRPAPSAVSTGVVAVISPGYQETGRNFHEQTDLLTRKGHEVIVFDHQWAGYTYAPGARLRPGFVDRGFGVARDVAAAGALASALAGDGGRVVLVGTSMGAGPGVLGALALSGAGQLELSLSGEVDGIALDGQLSLENVAGVLQSPYLAVTPSATNWMLAQLGRVPGLRSWPSPVIDLPVVTRDPLAKTRFAGHAARSDVRTRAETMYRAAPDLEQIKALARDGHVRQPLYVVHGSIDTMTDPEASRALVRSITESGGRAHLEEVPTKNHIFEEDPALQHHVVGAVDWAAKNLV
jgi:alpha-beta hydrolase superfamily lysophospholipase